MPLSPSTPQRPDDRRSASPKRQNDVMKSEVTVITKAAYNAILSGKGGSENLKVKRLCQLYNLLSQFMLYSDASLKDHNPQIEGQASATFNALRQCRTNVERALLRFPLNIQNPTKAP
jgi:hypothetical protein